MVKILKRILLAKIRFLSIFIKPNGKKITFIRKYYSGSNVTPVYEKMKDNKKGIIVELIHNSPDDMNIFNQTKLYLHLLKSKVIVTDHGVSFKTKRSTTVDLWHGIPLKGLNLMDKSEIKPMPITKIDYMSSYSPTISTLLNACFGMRIKNYKVLGSARNDYLFDKSNITKKRKILECSNNEKIVFYMPTFRSQSEQGELKTTDLRMKRFSKSEFNKFLKENNIKFILKPHPKENKMWQEVFEKDKSSNFKLVTEELLDKEKLELYQLLAISDLLITDYSSVYTDFLLTNKPILFIPTDLDKYRDTRNLLLEPYGFWSTGPKCFTQEELEKEIIKCIEDRAYYQYEREIIKNIFHTFQDDNSTDRTIEFLESLLV